MRFIFVPVSQPRPPPGKQFRLIDLSETAVLKQSNRFSANTLNINLLNISPYVRHSQHTKDTKHQIMVGFNHEMEATKPIIYLFWMTMKEIKITR